MVNEMYNGMNGTIRFSDIETDHHIQYVQGYTGILAKQYAQLYPRSGMTIAKIDKIVNAARLHDVGKIAIPDWILMKVGRLSDEELNILKQHTAKGYEILNVVGMTEDEEYNRICHNVCLYHHERYDGTGYPYGLKKDKIPIEAQLVALADMYDVLVHGAEGRQLFTKEEAYQMLLDAKFGELSPRMKECLMQAKEDMEAYCV